MKQGTDQLLKFKKLQKALKLPLWQAVGLLQTLWDFTSKNAPAGNIGRFENVDIAFAIEWEGDADELITALCDDWIEKNDEHRLIIHHWPDHCEDSVHRQLARAHQYFANGATPKLTRISKEERQEVEAFYNSTSCVTSSATCVPGTNKNVPGTNKVVPGKPQPLPKPKPEPEPDTPLTPQKGESKKTRLGVGKIPETYSPEFERHWEAWNPSTRGGRKKPAAHRAWWKALGKLARRSGKPLETVPTHIQWLDERAGKYANSPEGTGPFARAPATWLNDAGYDENDSEWQRTDGDGKHLSADPGRVRESGRYDNVPTRHSSGAK